MCTSIIENYNNVSMYRRIERIRRRLDCQWSGLIVSFTMFYTVLVGNPWTLSTAALIGESMDVREEASLPIFDSDTENITAIAGQTTILPCTVKNKGQGVKVIWLNPRTTLISTDDSRHIDDTRISVERPQIRNWNLMIRETRYNDSGRYMCQINTTPVMIKNIYLSVRVPPEIEEDWESLKMMEVREGETVQLLCNASGVPMPSVTWYREGSIITDDDSDQGIQGEIMLLKDITRYCEGSYKCVADNDVPPAAQKTFDVVVRFPPEVRLTVNRIGQFIGRETVLECKVSASPHASIIWKRNGTDIPLDQYKLWTEIFDDGKHEKSLHLNIIDISYDDYGYYTCHAANALGRDSETMLLHEYIIPTAAPPTTTHWGPARTEFDYSSYNIITQPHPGGNGFYRPRGEKGQTWGSSNNYNIASKNHTSSSYCLVIVFCLYYIVGTIF